MKIGITNRETQSRNRPGYPSWTMGMIPRCTDVQVSEVVGAWARISIKPPKWILLAHIDIIGEELPPPPPVVPEGNLYMLIEHSQLPPEQINYGSFGILRLYAEAAEQKPHSIFVDNAWLEYTRAINTAAAFQWIWEHNDTKFFGSHLDGQDYCIPAQGVFHHNYIRVTGSAVRGLRQVVGLQGTPPDPATINYFTAPDLVHLMWCVSRDGRTILPPCGPAFFPVLNPAGLRGSNVAGHVQTQIWIPDRYLLRAV